MASLNRAEIIGNLGNDPESRSMPNGNMVCNISVATTDKWRDKQTGDAIERTEWHRVTLYKGLADIAEKYLRKGSKVYIDGKLRTRKWTDNNGVDRYTTEVVGNNMIMLDGKQGSNDSNSGSYTRNQGSNQTPQSQPVSDDFDDDIPF